MSKRYPECGYLGSNVAELTAFALTLKLLAKLKEQGHTERCALAQVGLNSPCICCQTEKP